LSDAGLATAKHNQSDMLLLQNQKPPFVHLHCYCRYMRAHKQLTYSDIT